MVRVVTQITSANWFWYFAVPLASVVIVLMLNLLSKRDQDSMVWSDFSVGSDICIEGWGVNLGFLASGIGRISGEMVTVFLAVMIGQVLVFLCNAVFLRFSSWHPLLRTFISILLGIAALSLAVIAWR